MKKTLSLLTLILGLFLGSQIIFAQDDTLLTVETEKVMQEEVKEEVKEDVKGDVKEEVKEKEDNFDETSLVQKPEKELISVDKISDNETIDEFFNDVSKIIENKTGMPVNKEPEKYTLFEDVEDTE